MRRSWQRVLIAPGAAQVKRIPGMSDYCRGADKLRNEIFAMPNNCPLAHPSVPTLASFPHSPRPNVLGAKCRGSTGSTSVDYPNPKFSKRHLREHLDHPRTATHGRLAEIRTVDIQYHKRPVVRHVAIEGIVSICP